MPLQLRTINRGANPFAPIAKQKNQALSTPRNGVYEKLEDRVKTFMSTADNKTIIEVNAAIRNHPIENIGATLRKAMTAMKQIVK